MTLVSSATFCLILEQSPCLIATLYSTLFFLQKMSLILPTNHKIRGLVISQRRASIHSSVHTSLHCPAIILYTSVVDFVYFSLPVEDTHLI